MMLHAPLHEDANTSCRCSALVTENKSNRGPRHAHEGLRLQQPQGGLVQQRAIRDQGGKDKGRRERVLYPKTLSLGDHNIPCTV